VDIQPIATQISKLRFFISLIVDQRVDKDKPNFGIRALPNLETKFVAANTLIGIDKPKDQMSLFENQEIKRLEQELKNIRHRIFSAKSPGTKRRLRDKDKEIREKMGELLVEHGWANETAKQLASWDPYDQNASSPFFDSEWMFDIKDGFDVVIGNPPYVKEYTDKNAFEGLRKNKCYQGKMDIWYLFGEFGIDVLKTRGVLSFIATNHWIANAGASLFRNKVLTESEMQKFIDFGDYKIFESAGIQTMIFSIVKRKFIKPYECFYSKIKNKDINQNELDSFLKGQQSNKWCSYASMIDMNLLIGKPITFINQNDTIILNQIEEKQNFRLKDSEVAQGIVGAPDKAFLVEEKEYFTKEERVHVKTFHTHVDKYYTPHSDKSILYLSRHSLKLSIDSYPNIKKHFSQYKDVLTKAKIQYKTPNKPYYFLHREREIRFFERGAKIICATRTLYPSCTYTDIEFYGSRALNFIKTNRINLKYLCAILNSSLSNYYLTYKGKYTGDLLQIDKSQLLSIPIFISAETKVFEVLIDILLFLKKNRLNEKSIKIENIIDGLILELYFPHHMKYRNIDILKFVEKDIEEVMQNREFDQLSDDQKEKVIKQLHTKWSDPQSEIVKRMNSFAEKSPDILKPILEGR